MSASIDERQCCGMLAFVSTVTAAARPNASAACCGPAEGEPLPVEQAERLAALLKAVADPARLRLLSLVARSGNGEACICDLTGPVGLTQPTVSHHMRILVGAGLLTRQQRGKWAYYRVVPGSADRLAAAVLSSLQPTHELAAAPVS